MGLVAKHRHGMFSASYVNQLLRVFFPYFSRTCSITLPGLFWTVLLLAGDMSQWSHCTMGVTALLLVYRTVSFPLIIKTEMGRKGIHVVARFLCMDWFYLMNYASFYQCLLILYIHHKCIGAWIDSELQLSHSI